MKLNPQELIRVFCCPTVNILSLQERQAGAFWCHEFLWPMERRNVLKKSNIGLFSWRLDHFLQKMHSQSNEWIKQNENKHFHNFFIDWVKHCTITAFFVQDLVANPGVIGCTSRKVPSPSLKSLSPEPRLPPKPYLFPLSCFWTVVMLVKWGHGCSPWLNILINRGFPSLIRSNAKQISTKSTGQGAQGAGIINRWAARLN